MSRSSREEDKTPLPPELAATRLPRYRKLRRNVVSITAVVAMAPLIVLTTINYLQDRDAYRVETRYAVSQVLSNTKRALESVIEERRSALALVINEQSYGELNSDSALAITLQNLKNAFGGFVDLGLIDADGRQSYYTGPYDLKNRDYKDQTWFHEVVLRGSFVSDVFMGHRNFPHFVVAFKRDRERGSFYILRATIDMELINKQVYSLNLDRNTDVFVINQDGVLQTESVFYGPVLQKAPITVSPVFRSREMIDESKRDGRRVTTGYAYIEGSPFILIVIKRLDNPLAHWFAHRSDVLWFLLVSLALVLAVILYGSERMARQLREADLRRTRALHAVEYTNKMATIGRMAAGVAHEINNPMAIINEKAGLIKDVSGFSGDFPQKEKILGAVDSILKSVERCSTVTHRLLGFARRMEVRKEQIDLSALVKEVVGFQQTEATHRNIQVVYDIPPELPAIEGDRGQLQQVFLNILSNALAAVDTGGRIDISLHAATNDAVAVTIADNGSGIAEENLQHIFEPFFSTKGEFGTGLGLSITRDIVQKAGGSIDVKSKLGQGTQITVTLPVKKVSFGE